MEADVPLHEFYDKIYKPLFLAGSSPKTIVEYDVSVHYWRQIVGDATTLPEITNITVAEYRAGLTTRPSRTGKTLANSTCNKHLKAILSILSKAGPPGYRNRDALGLLPSAPWCRLLKTPRRRPRGIPSDALAAIYAACDGATSPILGYPPSMWWRSLITMGYFSGLRREGLLSLRWVDIDLDNAEFRLPAEFDKCDQDRRKPLHPVVVQHLRLLPRVGELVWLYTESRQTWYRTWWRILKRAGFPRGFKFHDLKRTCGTALASSGSLWAVREMLDHSSIRTSELYVDPTSSLRPSVEAMPFPALFATLGRPPMPDEGDERNPNQRPGGDTLLRTGPDSGKAAIGLVESGSGCSENP